MINQLKIENTKWVRSVLFWCFVVLMAVCGVSFGMKMAIQYKTTDIMHPFYDSLPDVSLFFAHALFTAWFIGYDFSSRTIHHEISSGASRLSVLITRALPAIAASVIIHLAQVSSTVFGLGAYIGLDGWNLSSDKFAWIGTTTIQFIALECFFIMISFLCCNLYVGLIASVISEIGLCNIARNICGEQTWYKYSFFHLVEDSNSTELGTYAVVAVVSIVVISVITYLAFRRREI